MVDKSIVSVVMATYWLYYVLVLPGDVYGIIDCILRGYFSTYHRCFLGSRAVGSISEEEAPSVGAHEKKMKLQGSIGLRVEGKWHFL